MHLIYDYFSASFLLRDSLYCTEGLPLVSTQSRCFYYGGSCRSGIYVEYASLRDILVDPDAIKAICTSCTLSCLPINFYLASRISSSYALKISCIWPPWDYEQTCLQTLIHNAQYINVDQSSFLNIDLFLFQVMIFIAICDKNKADVAEQALLPHKEAHDAQMGASGS
jgi:hypothetical protein